MENIELYFLRSFEQEIAKEILPYAARVDNENKTLKERPELNRYVEHYGLYKSDIGVYAMVDNKMVGAAWVRLLSGDNNRGFAYVDDKTPELTIGVKPEYRNLGIGTKILEQLMHEVSVSFPQISLYVSADSPAIKLYERFGFTKVEASHRHELHKGLPILTMVKQLTPPVQESPQEDWYQATQKWRNDSY